MIGIVTHYEVHNHGAQLQLFALIKEIEKKGYTAKALTFEKDYRYLDSSAKNKYKISIKSIPFYLKYLIQKGLRKTLFNIKKKKIFDSFRAENSILGCSYNAFDDELLITGSDEVFSTEVGITDAFWGMNSKAKKIISYAASFGPTTLEQIKSKKEDLYISQALNHFEKISVRDKNSFDIVKKLAGIESQLVCDPVILYGYKNEILEASKKCKVQNFILLYSYDNNMNNPEEIQLVRYVAEYFHLPVYSVGFYHSWCDKNINASPIQLLGYFKNASFVITDTFHGSVMSLITESDFAVFVRGNSNKLCNLLNEYDLSSRIYKNADECKKILSSEIDYEKVNQQIENYRKQSENFLTSILEKIHE